LLAHYLHAAYRYGSEELLRVLRIAIRLHTFELLRGIRGRIVGRIRPSHRRCAQRGPVMLRAPAGRE